MGSKKFADTRSNAFNPSSRCHLPDRPAACHGGHPRYSAFTSLTRRVSDDLASPKSMEVLGA